MSVLGKIQKLLGTVCHVTPTDGLVLFLLRDPAGMKLARMLFRKLRGIK